MDVTWQCRGSRSVSNRICIWYISLLDKLHNWHLIHTEVSHRFYPQGQYPCYIADTYSELCCRLDSFGQSHCIRSLEESQVYLPIARSLCCKGCSWLTDRIWDSDPLINFKRRIDFGWIRRFYILDSTIYIWVNLDFRRFCSWDPVGNKCHWWEHTPTGTQYTYWCQNYIWYSSD